MTTIEGLRVTRAVVATGGAVALAALCWMSAADRATATSAHPRTSYFGGNAAAQVAFGQIAAGNPDGALAAARRAVQTAPVDPATTSALGSALLTLGQADQAYAAFSVAGALGWREIPTQLYWLAQAGAAGDVEVITQRLDALLRLDIENEAVENSLLMLGRAPVGQQALAALLLKDPPWEHRFLSATGDLDGVDLKGRIAAIRIAARQGASFDCEAVGIAANRLIRNDQAADAKRLWRQACERSDEALISNGSFEADPSITSHSPFVWQLRSEGGLEVGIEKAPPPLDGHAMRIGSSMTARTIAARQLTALQPGRYRLSWSTTRAQGKPDASITVLVHCQGSSGELTPLLAPDATQDNRATTTFAVPAEGCPIQTVAIQKAASGLGETQAGWVDDIRIVPLANDAPTS